MALEQPKRPAGGGYGVFLSENRADFTKKCAGQRVSAVAKMAGEEWKKLSAAQKAPYEKKFAEAKAKYDKDMAAFLAAGGVKEKGVRAARAEKRKAKEGKAKKDPNAPKKPVGGAYGVWLNENREKIAKSLPKDHKITDVAKAGSEMWKKLSAAEKKSYEDAFAKKQAEYKAAMEEYKNAQAEAGEDEEEGDEEEAEEEEEEEEAVPKKKLRKAGA